MRRCSAALCSLSSAALYNGFTSHTLTHRLAPRPLTHTHTHTCARNTHTHTRPKGTDYISQRTAPAPMITHRDEAIRKFPQSVDGRLGEETRKKGRASNAAGAASDPVSPPDATRHTPGTERPPACVRAHCTNTHTCKEVLTRQGYFDVLKFYSSVWL